MIGDFGMELYTSDLILRTVEGSDIEEVARMWDFQNGDISLDEAKNAIEYMQNNHTQNKIRCIHHLCFAIFEKGENKIIGWCGLDGKTADRLFIFFLIAEEYRNEGYATQAAKRLLSYAFDEASVPFVNGGCDKNNIASFKVMTKLGMNQSGFEENGDPLFYIDDARYRML